MSKTRGPWRFWLTRAWLPWVFLLPVCTLGADLAGSKDPPGMKRYEGSEIIGYRAPKFDELLLPLGPPTQLTPPAYAKSLAVEGQVSRYTYMAPTGRSPAEILRNYKSEFQRLSLETLYEKTAADKGWFGPTLDHVAVEDGLKQILAYNEAEERVIVGKSNDAQPTYYYVFVTSYHDGLIPEHLKAAMTQGRVLVELIVVAPEQMQQKMTFVTASDMSKSLAASGRVALYGLYFDTDKDLVRADSQRTLQEIAQLLKNQPQLRVHIVGHTDSQGTAEHNLDLSRRRAANVVRELTSKYAIDAARLDSFGAAWYAPIASNDSEEGRAKNRRVELVKW
jgi:outer membrane protein OmpA-like peptidoglycan-associated protein